MHEMIKDNIWVGWSNFLLKMDVVRCLAYVDLIEFDSFIKHKPIIY